MNENNEPQLNVENQNLNFASTVVPNNQLDNVAPVVANTEGMNTPIQGDTNLNNNVNAVNEPLNLNVNEPVNQQVDVNPGAVGNINVNASLNQENSLNSPNINNGADALGTSGMNTVQPVVDNAFQAASVNEASINNEIAPSVSVDPTIGGMQPQNITDATTIVPNNQQQNEKKEKPKNKSSKLLIFIAIFALAVGGVVAYKYYFAKPSSAPVVDNTTTNNATNEEVTETDEENTTSNNTVSLTMFEVQINNETIAFPTTKESFDKINWSFDESLSSKELAKGMTESNVRIGTAPGGAEVSFVNNLEETKKLLECTIDDVTFFNPGNDTEIKFIAGITFKSTKEEVKTNFEELGYKNLSEGNAGNSYKYYLEDNKDNYKDYIEFEFENDTLNKVTIKTSHN